jgi:hypothetical protein
MFIDLNPTRSPFSLSKNVDVANSLGYKTKKGIFVSINL